MKATAPLPLAKVHPFDGTERRLRDRECARPDAEAHLAAASVRQKATSSGPGTVVFVAEILGGPVATSNAWS